MKTTRNTRLRAFQKTKTFASLSLAFLLLVSPRAYCQPGPLSELIPVSSGLDVSGVVHSSAWGDGVLAVDNNLILHLNATNGAIASAKILWKYQSTITINAGATSGNSLYVAGATQDSGRTVGYVLKYDLSNNQPRNNAIFYMGDRPIATHFVTLDNDGNVYLVGSMYDTVTTRASLIVVKTDTNMVVSWARQLSNTTLSISPTGIQYLGERAVMVAGIGYSGIDGIVFTAALDSSGNLIRTKAMICTSGPRFGDAVSTVFGHSLVTAYRTFSGPSDTGPTLILKSDTGLNIQRTQSFFGLDVQGISNNGRDMVIVGQAPITYGRPGFRSVRLDSTLRVKAAGYYHRIATSSPATTSSCYLAANGSAYHYMHVMGNNEVNMAITDTTENVECGDTAFTPSTATITYPDTLFPLTNTAVGCRVKSFVAYAMDTRLVNHASCDPNGVNDISSGAEKFIIYPNPATEWITISNCSNTSFRYQITDLSGKVLLEGAYSNSINIAALAPGSYCLQIVQGNERIGRLFTKR